MLFYRTLPNLLFILMAAALPLAALLSSKGLASQHSTHHGHTYKNLTHKVGVASHLLV
jgi:hypothetical protein